MTSHGAAKLLAGWYREIQLDDSPTQNIYKEILFGEKDNGAQIMGFLGIAHHVTGNNIIQ